MVPGQSPGSRPAPRGESVGGTQFPTTASRGPGATPDSLGDSESGPAGIRFRTSLQVTACPAREGDWNGYLAASSMCAVSAQPGAQDPNTGAWHKEQPRHQPSHATAHHPVPVVYRGPPPRVGRYPTRRKLARLRKPFAKAPRIEEQSKDSGRCRPTGKTTSNAVCDTESRSQT